MKSNPAVPGGSLTSKPTWWNTSKCFATSAFFVFGVAGQPQRPRVKGRIKEAAGALSGNDKLREEGKTDQAVGKVKKAVNKVFD